MLCDILQFTVSVLLHVAESIPKRVCWMDDQVIWVRYPVEPQGFSLFWGAQSDLSTNSIGLLRWVEELFSSRQNGRCVILIPYLQLVPRFRMRGAIPPHFHTPLFSLSCALQGFSPRDLFRSH